MSIHTELPVWLNETTLCSFDDLAELSGLSRAELTMLVDSGVLHPAPAAPASGSVFYASCVVQVRAARRLRDDFELDQSGLAVAVNLLARIQDLEHQLRELDAKYRR